MGDCTNVTFSLGSKIVQMVPQKDRWINLEEEKKYNAATIRKFEELEKELNELFKTGEKKC